MGSSNAYARGRGTTADGVAPKEGRPAVQQPLQTALPQDHNDDETYALVADADESLPPGLEEL